MIFGYNYVEIIVCWFFESSATNGLQCYQLSVYFLTWNTNEWFKYFMCAMQHILHVPLILCFCL